MVTMANRFWCFPAPVADGTLPWVPETELPPLEPGLQPVPEPNPPEVEPDPIADFWFYGSLKQVTLRSYTVASEVVNCSSGDSSPGGFQGERSFTVDIPSHPGGTLVQIETRNNSNGYACGDGTDDNEVIPGIEITVYDQNFDVISGPTGYFPHGDGTFYNAANSYSIVQKTWLEDISYYPQTDQGEWTAPGPVLPQPDPYPEVVIPQPPVTTALRMAVPSAPDQPPLPRPWILPGTAPDREVEPLVEPQPEVAPNVTTSPTPLPTIATSPQPVNPNQTAPDSSVVPIPDPPVPPTPPDHHFPVSGGPPVGSGGGWGDLTRIGKEVGRIEQKTARGLSLLDGLDGIDDLLDLLDRLVPPEPVPAQTLEMLAACDYNANDELAKFSISYPQQEILTAILERVNDIPEFLQQHLAWKTPTCGNEKPVLEGDWVTINWISEEASSDSPLRLRKRTRYRSKSGRDSEQLQQYFRTFEWDAGPVCVIHADAWWGTPQVWAASVDEGKRVIRHIAGEAGIDPDQIGRWIVSGSRNPRQGMYGRMMVRAIEGFPWVSSRPNSNMLPM